MWYKFDVHQFAEQMLPPQLRSKVLLSFLRALLRPLAHLIRLFHAFREEVLRRLSYTGQTQSLEGALSRKYNLPEGVIYITDTPSNQRYLYLATEGNTPLYLRKSSEPHTALFISYQHEGKHDVDFIVHVPSFLRAEEAEIRRIIDFYKPAGKTYKITYYNYE